MDYSRFPATCSSCHSTLRLENLFVNDGCPCHDGKWVNFTPRPCKLCKQDCVKPGHHIEALFGTPAPLSEKQEEETRYHAVMQWDRVRSALGLDILHEEAEILEAIQALKDQLENSVRLNMVPNDDEMISCIFCRHEAKCEHAFVVRRNGERAAIGIHAACIAPYRKRNESSLWTTPASEWVYEDRDLLDPNVTPAMIAAAMAAPEEDLPGRVSTEERLMVLHATTEALVEWFRKGPKTDITPLRRWKKAARDFMGDGS